MVQTIGMRPIKPGHDSGFSCCGVRFAVVVFAIAWFRVLEV